MASPPPALPSRRASTMAPMTSARSPGTITRLPGPIRWSMCSGSIAPIATPPMTRSRSGPGWRVSPWTPSRTIARVGLDRMGRYGRTPSNGIPCLRKALFKGARQARLGVEIDLVHDRARHVHAVTFEQGGVEDDLVDRPADAALRDDDRRRPEHRCDDGVREPDHRPDPGMARPLDEQDVALGREGGMGVQDPLRQVRHHTTFDVGLGEPPWDVDRTHPGDGLAEVEDALHEDGVLVGRDAFLDDGSLADRLHESRGQSSTLEAVHHAQADRGLAAVLTGRGEIDVTHRSGRVAHRSGRASLGVSRGWRSCVRSGRRHRAGATTSPRRRPQARDRGPDAP